MSNIYKSADELIGKTPLLELTHIEKKYNLKGYDNTKKVIYDIYTRINKYWCNSS